MNVEDTMTFKELFENYIRMSKLKNLSPYTIRTYTQAYERLNSFVELETLLLSEVNKDLIDDYIMHLQNKGLKDTSVKSIIKNTKPIINMGIKNGYIKPFEFTIIKVNQEIKEIYTEAELKTLLEKPNIREVQFSKYRNWVIINFLLGTGVRRLELVNIKLKHVDLQQAIILLARTKNRKQRYVPLSSSLLKVLREYMMYRKGEEEDYLFPNIYGEQLNEDTLSNEIYKYNKKRGVRKTSVHLFRHTFGSMYIAQGGNPLTLMRILGHSNMKMVNHYVHLNTDSLVMDNDKYNPLERFSSPTKRAIKI